MVSFSRFLLLSFGLLTGFASYSFADTGSRPHEKPAIQPQSIVDKASANAQDFFIGADGSNKLVKTLAASRAVMICSSQSDADFGLNRSRGPCTLLAKDRRGLWSDPAFYTLTSGKGFKFGMEDGDTKFMFFIMTDRGFLSILDREFTFNPRSGPSYADLDTMTNGIEPTEQNADILSIRKTNERFVRSDIRGSKFGVSSSANWAYYRQAVGPEDILIRMQTNNPNANLLRRVLLHYSRMNSVHNTLPRGDIESNGDL